MATSASARTNSGLAQILAGIVLLVIGFIILKDHFWQLVFVAAGFLTILMGGGNLRRAHREFNQQEPGQPSPARGESP